MESSPSTLEQSPLEPRQSMSLAARLLNVFAAPGEVFDSVKAAPVAVSNWLVPAGLLIVMSWLSAALVFQQPAVRQQMADLRNKSIDRQVERGKLSATQADQARTAAEKWGTVGAAIAAVVFPVFLGLISPFWWGLILWLAGTKGLKGNFAYMKAVEIAGLGNIILTLDAVVRTCLVLATGNVFASPSLMLLVKDFDPQNTVHGLLAAVNVMVFWLLVVRSIGLARVAGTVLWKAAFWVFGVWILINGFLMGLAAVGRAISGT